MQLCLTLTSGTTYLGGTGEISALYKSTNGTYASDIQALVYVDGEYAGEAIKLPRTPPGPGQDDPGQGFTYDLPATSLGGYEVEFIIINGAETVSATQTVSVEASPISDDYEFLKALWNGLFDRNPEGTEINGYLAVLRDGSMTRQQVISNLRSRGEFVNARDLLIADKTLHGSWRVLSSVLEDTSQAGYGSNTNVLDSPAAMAEAGIPYKGCRR